MGNLTMFVGDGDLVNSGTTLVKFNPELGLIRIKIPRVIIDGDGVTRIAVEDEE